MRGFNGESQLANSVTSSCLCPGLGRSPARPEASTSPPFSPVLFPLCVCVVGEGLAHLQTGPDCFCEHALYPECEVCPRIVGLALLLCYLLIPPQERVSSIHPEDLMQIISHVDSRDNHRVRDCGLRVVLAPTPHAR